MPVGIVINGSHKTAIYSAMQIAAQKVKQRSAALVVERGNLEK